MEFANDGPPDSIEVGALHLARPQSSDRDEVTALLAASDEIARWTTIPYPYKLEHFDQWVETDAGSYLIRFEGRIVGAAGAAVDPTTATAELGYWLAPFARGAGRAVTAAGTVCALAFEQGAQRVFASVIVGNLASSVLLDRLGFTLEGVQRSVASGSCGLGQARIDLQMWSLLPGELT